MLQISTLSVSRYYSSGSLGKGGTHSAIDVPLCRDFFKSRYNRGMKQPVRDPPNSEALQALASLQAGCFSTAQAAECGFSPALCWHCSKKGRFHRIRRGIYRITDFPQSGLEVVFAAWLFVGPGRAVVSHATALALFGLIDGQGSTIHLTISRKFRRDRIAGIQIHTAADLPAGTELTEAKGLPATTVGRSIVDSAGTCLSDRLLIETTDNAIRRGLASRTELLFLSQTRSGPVRQLIRRSLQGP